MTFDPKSRPSKLERSLKADANLREEQTLCYVVQAVNSANPDHPRWSTLYWWAYGPALERFKNHHHRIGRGDDSPKFTSLDTALAAWEAVKSQKTPRVRVIARYEAILEQIVE